MGIRFGEIVRQRASASFFIGDTLAQDFRSPGEWLDFLLALNLPLRLQLAGVEEDRLPELRSVATAAMAPAEAA